MKTTVIVAGAGPAGAVAALALARAGHAVVMLDGGGGATARAGETLPAAALPILRDLGLFHAFTAQSHVPCAGNVSAWGSPVPHVSDAICNPLGHGWQIDRRLFDQMLRDQAQNAGVTVVHSTVRDIQRSASGWMAALDDGSQLHASWLIDATGRRRTIARRCGATVKRLDRLIAFHAHLKDDNAQDRDTRTLVESARDGWWYTSRVPGQGRMVAFVTDRDHPSRTEMLRADVFRRKLGETIHVSSVLSAYRWCDARPRGTDASSTRLACVTGDGWLAAGDAAIAFDPLSSQGIFNALYTGLDAGRAVAAALAGDDAQLAQYEARIESVYHAYVQHRRTYYGAETRWPAQPFWSRRTARHSFTANAMSD